MSQRSAEYQAERLRRTKIRKAKRRKLRKEAQRANKCEYDYEKICNGCMDC